MHNSSRQKNERTHLYEHGIRAAYPEPTVDYISAEEELPLLDVPYADPVKQAAIMARHVQWGDKYAAMADRYQGEDAWAAVQVPSAYLGQGPEFAFRELFRAYKGDQPFTVFHPWDEVGQEAFYSFGHDTSGTISRVQDPYTPSIEDARVTEAAHDPGLWMTYLHYGPATSYVTGPVGRVEFELPGTDGGQLIRTAETTPILLSPLFFGRNYHDIDMAIFLVLWGKFPRPVGVLDNRLADYSLDEERINEAWIRQIVTVAGRCLWQMAWIEYQLMIDDLTQRNLGGRGGLVWRKGAVQPTKGAKPLSVHTRPPITLDDPAAVMMRRILDFSNDVEGVVVPLLELLFSAE